MFFCQLRFRPCSQFGIGALHDSAADAKISANWQIVLSTANLIVFKIIKVELPVWPSKIVNHPS